MPLTTKPGSSIGAAIKRCGAPEPRVRVTLLCSSVTTLDDGETAFNRLAICAATCASYPGTAGVSTRERRSSMRPAWDGAFCAKELTVKKRLKIRTKKAFIWVPWIRDRCRQRSVNDNDGKIQRVNTSVRILLVQAVPCKERSSGCFLLCSV